MFSDWPTTCIRGPSTTPKFIASRKSTVLKPPRESMSATVVKPASKSVCALASATYARSAGARAPSLPPTLTCTCTSIMPGSTVASPRSITRASGGTFRFAPTSAILSPRIRIVWPVNMRPLRASNNRPARIATTCAAGARKRPTAPDPAAPPVDSCASSESAVAAASAQVATSAPAARGRGLTGGSLRSGALEARRVVRVALALVARCLRVRAERPRRDDLAVLHLARGDALGRLALLDPARDHAHPVGLVRSVAAAAVAHAGHHEQARVLARVRAAVAAVRLRREVDDLLIEVDGALRHHAGIAPAV